jgi:hypothetical protein
VRKTVIVLGLILIALGIILYITLPILKSHPTLGSRETMTIKAGSSVPRAFNIPVDAGVSGIDVNVLLNTILGGIVTISGSLAVAGLYIRNQNRNQRRRHLQELVQQTYFEQGVFPIMSALSEYGTNTTFALVDARILLGKHF